jgi:thymidylate synthase (FAD)
MKVILKTITPEAEVNIVEIARVSSSRTDKSEKPQGLINYLIKNKHWSPFEHAYMTVEITTSKAIGIQMLRHRSFTFQEFSQRYAKVSNIEETEFRMKADTNRQSSTVPIGRVVQDEDENSNQFIPFYSAHNLESTTDHKIQLNNWIKDTAALFEEVLRHYQEGLHLGIAKECARMVLPMATETTIYMTGSIRSWIHFLEIRDDAHAQLEIQLAAREIKRIFCEQCPLIAEARGFIVKVAENDADTFPSTI